MDGNEPALTKPRIISMSRNGRFVAIRQVGGVDVVDALGTNPRKRLEIDDPADFCFVGRELWVVGADGLHRLGSDGTALTDGAITDVLGTGTLTPATGELATAALWRGQSDRLVLARGDSLEIQDLGTTLGGVSYAKPITGDRLLLCRDGHVFIRSFQSADARALPGSLRISRASELFGGRVLAVFECEKRRATVSVLQHSGARIHRVEVKEVDDIAFAETRGLAIAYSKSALVALDLRYGRQIGRGEVPVEIEALAIDASGKFVAVAGFREDSDSLSVLHLPYTSLFAPGKRKSAPPASQPDGTSEPSETSDPAALRAKGHELGEPTAAASTDAAVVGEGIPDKRESSSDRDGTEEDIELPDTKPTALGQVPKPRRPPRPAGATPYQRADQHLEDLVDLIAARAAKAIADAWDSGRLSLPSLDALPFQREVRALVGDGSHSAQQAVEQANQRVLELAERTALRAQATLAEGRSLPFFDVVAEFGLSRVAAQALIVAAAPQIRGEAARLYGVLANDEGRPICDRYLIELVLGGDDHEARLLLARELEPDAPLIHNGLVRVLPAPPDMYLFAPITVDPVLIARLRGHPFAGYETGSVTEIHTADRRLDELAIDRSVAAQMLGDLAEPPIDGRPARVVLRGRPGSGRTTVLAALARRVGRALAMIDCERLPRAGAALAQRLRIELRRARLRGALPCVSGLEVSESAESEGIEHIRDVFRSHPGPVVFRTTPEYRPPLEPGYLDYVLNPLSEGRRQQVWADAAARIGLPVSSPAELASRFRIGPGTITNVLNNVRMRLDAGAIEQADDYMEEIDRTARQHIDSRLSSVASRVDRLAKWEQVALPEDLIDSVREFIGRVTHRRTVYESWGFDNKMSTSRGLTALFYGPPGTGKTMVAGLIARELNLDLYRVDLARITSKWVGETEKNLAQVFDAAEDGQAVIVFDEADSLFAKRTEVKSSVDRYANLEVNYLLQRLDSFEGIAILTTNLEGSIDNAFKRRLSLRLAFPFPDEEMRVRLWAAHLPPEMPTAGDFDFEDLAKRFPMSGGYIRNSTLRAAFLAAQEHLPLSQDHLLRAIQLEYREMGKLSAGGRIE